MVKLKVVIGVFKHAEFKFGLYFVLTLLFLPDFRKTTRFQLLNKKVFFEMSAIFEICVSSSNFGFIVSY